MTNEVKTTAPDRWGGRERRKHPRKRSLLHATLVTNSGSFDCRVLDFSRGGAKVESHVKVAPEQAVTLILKPIGTFAGVVAWCAAGCFGMRFLVEHGRAVSSSADVTAALSTFEGSGRRSEQDAGKQDSSKAPQAASENAVVLNDVPGPHPGAETPIHKSRASPKRSLALFSGDVICLLRKKVAGQTSTVKRSPGISRGTETITLKDIANCRFVEIDARHFLEFTEQKSAFAVTLLRVVSSGARASRKSSHVGNGNVKTAPRSRLDVGAKPTPSSARRPLLS